MTDHAATLPQSFESNARHYGARVFLKDKRDRVWRDHSWPEVSDAAGELRAGLLRIGINPAIASRFCPRIAPNGSSSIRPSSDSAPLSTRYTPPAAPRRSRT